jgi:sec-independent protein translocase protein TatC
MEAFPLRAVAHDERLTTTQHLGELRARLLLSVAVLAVLFAGCLWQSRALLRVLNAPLAHVRTRSAPHGAGSELSQALARSAGRSAGVAPRRPVARRRQPFATARRCAHAGHARAR